MNSDATRRKILRWIHIVFSVPIIGYIYSPPAQAALYASRVRYFFLPILAISGLWMWKGHLVRRFFSNRST